MSEDKAKAQEGLREVEVEEERSIMNNMEERCGDFKK